MKNVQGLWVRRTPYVTRQLLAAQDHVDAWHRMVALVATKTVSHGVDVSSGKWEVLKVVTGLHDAAKVRSSDFIPPASELAQRVGRLHRQGPTPKSATARVKHAADRLRTAEPGPERRETAREFLEALAELIICLLRLLVRALLRLLSITLARTRTANLPTWQPEPIEESPQIAPRGPNVPFPVSTHRGGRRSSTLGNVVVAA
ncbi:hypothetical protein [Kitasatospora sp. NPDC056273]|uniref:hypothetical protein n=1 Tax=Kitasatospora sp. NPDC056273 TaxID=3345769 RepID=UPI0035D7922F